LPLLGPAPMIILIMSNTNPVVSLGQELKTHELYVNAGLAELDTCALSSLGREYLGEQVWHVDASTSVRDESTGYFSFSDSAKTQRTATFSHIEPYINEKKVRGGDAVRRVELGIVMSDIAFDEGDFWVPLEEACGIVNPAKELEQEPLADQIFTEADKSIPDLEVLVKLCAKIPFDERSMCLYEAYINGLIRPADTATYIDGEIFLGPGKTVILSLPIDIYETFKIGKSLYLPGQAGLSVIRGRYMGCELRSEYFGYGLPVRSQ